LDQRLAQPNGGEHIVHIWGRWLGKCWRQVDPRCRALGGGN